MRWIIVGAVALTIALGAYLASPFLTLLRLSSAFEARDARTISAHIDFPGLRQSLRNQLVVLQSGGATAADSPPAQDSRKTVQVALGPTIVDAVLQQLVTPTGIAMVLQNGWLDQLLGQPAGTAAAAGSSDTAASTPAGGTVSKASSALRHWAFVSPVRFRISLGRDADPQNWVTFRLRFGGFRWKIYDLSIPEPVGRELLNGRVPL